ncbi:fad binding domain-containing protein [Diaporthe amygdali]|uniref:fad binding domain-containing protein n=1 Tax=Phomopsis amygdali TaxID=1214568 RepID=UPI0022FDF1BB|nr:fad binding domain-containing protein [Diaporthe amygdali]KAJ0119822.1 fad binding domain-containing protein [Diaporthe amygdali]
MRFLPVIIVLVLGVSSRSLDALAYSAPEARTIDACNALFSLLPDDVVYPNSTAYITENTYWSNRQGEVKPACFVTPRSTANVSAIVKSLISLQAPFSVKAGGHTAFAGGSNVDQGVTIDLLKMADILVSDDSQTVSVGPGSRWIQVTEVLDPLGLAVVGGRVSDVGVSGLLLGGGISYFSGFRGWACDNVQNYEVVLSSGEVVNASPTENNDLFWALRGGGGSNFGIVTRFDLDVFPQGKLWANDILYPGALNTTLIPIFANLTINGLPEDPQAHTYFIMTYYPEAGGFVTAVSMYHATPPAANTTPAVFAPLKSPPGILSDTTTVENVSTALLAINQPYGDRQTWWDTSVFVTGSDLLTDIVPLWEEVVATFLSAAAENAGPNGTASSVTPYLVYQPIPMNVLMAMQKNGGNALGLETSDGPVMLVQLTITWDDAALDDVIESESSNLIKKVEAMAAERNELKGFVYMNYAGSTQEVLKRYGPENYKRLRDVAGKYDPEGLLQQFWKGYFQLEGVQ